MSSKPFTHEEDLQTSSWVDRLPSEMNIGIITAAIGSLALSNAKNLLQSAYDFTKNVVGKSVVAFLGNEYGDKEDKRQ
jgi:phage tail tape-measure protein